MDRTMNKWMTLWLLAVVLLTGGCSRSTPGASAEEKQLNALIDMLIDDRPATERFAAAYQLGLLHQEAEPAVPHLVSALREVANPRPPAQQFTSTEEPSIQDPHMVATMAASALANIRPKGISALIDELEHESPAVRALAAWGLGAVRRDTEEVVAALTNLRGREQDSIVIKAIDESIEEIANPPRIEPGQVSASTKEDSPPADDMSPEGAI